MASSDSHYRITGVQDGLDPDRDNFLREVPVRMDVDEWFLSQDLIHINQRALFFPAFWAFSQISPHERLSWFQIAGLYYKYYLTLHTANIIQESTVSLLLRGTKMRRRARQKTDTALTTVSSLLPGIDPTCCSAHLLDT